MRAGLLAAQPPSRSSKDLLPISLFVNIFVATVRQCFSRARFLSDVNNWLRYPVPWSRSSESDHRARRAGGAEWSVGPSSAPSVGVSIHSVPKTLHSLGEKLSAAHLDRPPRG